MGLRLRTMLVFLLMAGVSVAIVVAGIVFPLLDQYRQANAELAAAGRQSATLAADVVADRRDVAEKTLAAILHHEDLAYRNHAAASRMLAVVAHTNRAIQTLVAIEASGQVVAASHPGQSARLGTLAIVEAARKTPHALWSDRLSWPSDGSATVALAQRYRYYDRQGEHWGVLVAAADLGGWNAMLNRQRGHVEIFDRAGQRLVPPPAAKDPDGTLREEVTEALAGHTGSRVVGDEAVMAYAPVPGAGWAVVASAPAAETLLPINRSIAHATRYGLIALLVAGVMSFWLSGLIIAPIRRLEAGASALARGEWEATEVRRLPPAGSDEIGRLSASFGVMAAQLRDRFAAIEDEVALRTKELERANGQLTFVVAELKELDELKRAFLDAVSHELRTPLNFIMGYGSGLEDGLFGELNEEQIHAVTRIMEGSERLLGVINDLIEVSQLQAGRLKLAPQPIEMAELLGLAIEQLERTAQERQVSLSLAIAPQLPPAWADPERVGQILRQLLSNACKFTEPGGAVTMKASLRDERVLVEVIDTGVGISEAALPRIWESFRQGDGSLTRRHGGTGVGLTIVKRLIETMEQQVGVESALGQGSRFWFTLPVARVGELEQVIEATVRR